jgi:hypothetical protein
MKPRHGSVDPPFLGFRHALAGQLAEAGESFLTKVRHFKDRDEQEKDSRGSTAVTRLWAVVCIGTSQQRSPLTVEKLPRDQVFERHGQEAVNTRS